MTITEFFARMDNVPEKLRADIFLVAHLIALHQGRDFRDSGDLFLDHCFDVMYQMKQIGMDDETILAAGLHDLIEDTIENTKVTAKDLLVLFNENVVFLVESVSKKPKRKFRNKAARLKEFHKRWIASARKNFRVIFIKCADRQHNLLTLHGLFNDPEKQQRIAKETLEFYVPFLRGEAKDIVPKKYHRILDSYATRMEHYALAQIEGNFDPA